MRRKDITFRVAFALPVLALVLVACAQVDPGRGLFEAQAEQPASQISNDEARDLISPNRSGNTRERAHARTTEPGMGAGVGAVVHTAELVATRRFATGRM